MIRAFRRLAFLIALALAYPLDGMNRDSACVLLHRWNATLGRREFLIGLRGPGTGEGKWCLLGGKREIGERYHETAAREVKEETGIELELAKLRGCRYYDHLFPGGGRNRIFIVFGNRISIRNFRRNREIRKLRWASLEELEELLLQRRLWGTSFRDRRFKLILKRIARRRPRR
jgi:8-oxo-dGTP pyrophosphatase MutT (NUDIX family)